MANEERGEVELVCNGSSYTLALSMNAICELQTRTKKTYGQLVSDMAGLDVVALRDILWMTLKKYHAQDFRTAESVGAMVDEAGGTRAAVDAINRLFEVNARKDKAATADPQTAQS